jgi:hypothetical protein
MIKSEVKKSRSSVPFRFLRPAQVLLLSFELEVTLLAHVALMKQRSHSHKMNKHIL